MTNDLRELEKQDRNIRKTLEGMQFFVEHYSPDLVDQVAIRLQRLEEVFQEFHAVRRKIELLTEDVFSEDEEEVDQKESKEQPNVQIMMKIENVYYKIKAALTRLLPKSTPVAAVSGVQPPPAAAPAVSRVKLPEIRLPSFGGQLREWVTFRDSFRSLIHNNQQLSAMDKFTYLRSSLTGEALQEINSVEMTEANYDVAWVALERRYENKKLIVKAHLDSLFSVEVMKKESYESLSKLIGDFEKNLLMLDKIGENTANWSTILVYMICSRLDPVTLRQWEAHHKSNAVPTYANLIQFLREHCSVLQSIEPSNSIPVQEKRSKVGVSNAAVQSWNKCLFCGESFHSAFRCFKFLKMKVPERLDVARRSKVCLNCLTAGHYAKSCTKGCCHHCQQKHHSLLHTDSSQQSPPPVKSSVPSQKKPPSSNQQQHQTQPHTSSHSTPTQTITPSTSALPVTHSPNTQPLHTTNQTCTSQNSVSLSVSNRTGDVLLSTAVVSVKDQYGATRLARALLDSCSQFCFMTTNFSQKLKLRGFPDHLTVQGIGGSNSVSRRRVNARILPRSGDISSYNEDMSFYILPELTATLPVQRISVGQWKPPSSIVLADPQFCEPGQIDIIIGAEYFYDLLIEGRCKISEEGPTLQNTVFGWIVSGRIPDQPVSPTQAVSFSCTLADIQDQLARFWELETCKSSSIQSVEESTCETIFDETTTRDSSGRFIVSLPKKEFVMQQLGECKTIATKRFLALERRLEANPELKTQYHQFIREYEQLGHMKQVDSEDPDFPIYFLPHHAVLKPDSTTTKLRVVFDASCKTSTGVSLNDALMVGPVVQDDLLAIQLRFRLHRIAVVADVEKMYRMILVYPSDQRLQCILWRNTPNEPIRTYQLATVTYGTACAPYLATKCLQRLAELEAERYPVAAKAMKENYYVDDMLSGTDNLEAATQLISEMLELASSGGFTLRKWNSNSNALLDQLPENLVDRRPELELDTANTPVKTLGLLWDTTSDSFLFRSPVWNSEAPITKRIVLADTARLFDPIGLVGPVIVAAKIFVQDLWKQKCDWDEPLPEAFQNFWIEYRRNLSALSSLSIPRWVAFSTDLASVQVHGFCDASNKAYGACLYLRSTTFGGSVEVRLITAKSKVTPLEDLKRKKRVQTTPRLELSGALLLSHLYEKFVASTAIQHTAFFWTDSTIVMYWLSSLPSRWQMFVANRVSEIQHATKGCLWNHVAGEENPADIISRGMTPAQLQYERLWFEGPLWLRQDASIWPSKAPEEEIDPAILEEKKVVALPATAESVSEIFSLRSSLFSLVRLVAGIRRFVHNTQHRQDRRTGFLTFPEHEQALIFLVQLAQQEAFPAEIAALNKNNPVSPSSSISRLNPVLVSGILCVGGRLAKAPVSASRKHPMILSHHHPLARLVLHYYHCKHFHSGLQLLVSTVRERFWITRIRSLANSVLHECVRCFRTRPKVLDQLMADLPSERVSPAAPFLRVGVDYCGPFLIKYPVRRATPTKHYVAIFICLVTKAVHLELASDLTSEAFLAAFKRFVARRGKPILVMCDNATNFVGAKRQLDELRQLFIDQTFQESIVRGAVEDDIEFRFIPARSPNFGGLWEAAVKSFKGHFKRTIGDRVLQYDEMITVLPQVEAILNSRPLTPVSNDPLDFEALTPGHFLVQRPLTAVPEPSLEDLQRNRLSMWQQAQDYVQQIWTKWSTQFLSDLHNRTKWTRKRDNISVGTLVLLKEDKLPPLRWKLGRVIQIHPGSDGNIRVVTVKAQDGEYQRAISKICVLPIRDNLESEQI
ncbi:uncharacterized protein LOC134290629 [Aedes albopictus]|uniref:Integrase catalytic domain-containing protein n=1 Tax=Aedes albopictus TaxID=7160 RepID=A0ABM1Y156_AEDAL